MFREKNSQNTQKTHGIKKNVSPKKFKLIKKKMKNTNGSNGINFCPIFKIIFNLFVIIFILFIVFLPIRDFFTKLSEIVRNKNIDADNCREEYFNNECDKIVVDDGPWKREICAERKKCSEPKVYGYEIILDIIKDILFKIFDIKKEGFRKFRDDS